MATYTSLNDRTLHWIEQQVVANEDDLQVKTHVLQNGARVIDFGCNVSGGIEAGLALSKICMGLSANVQLTAADRAIWNGPQLLVSTDSPLKSCMASQYAGWKISHGKYFAMGSGPMRAKRGKEAVLDRFVIGDHSKSAIGVLESDELPTDEITEQIASECNVQTSKLVLCVASTSSIAGVMQVVARSIETSLHKLFELDFDLNQIRSGVGSAHSSRRKRLCDRYRTNQRCDPLRWTCYPVGRCFRRPTRHTGAQSPEQFLPRLRPTFCKNLQSLRL